jgi:hypothetical protein
LILLGEYDRALASAERARHLYETIGDEQQLARLEINVGNIHHRQDLVTSLPPRDVSGRCPAAAPSLRGDAIRSYADASIRSDCDSRSGKRVRGDGHQPELERVLLQHPADLS